jgi:hypothetical protein
LRTAETDSLGLALGAIGLCAVNPLDIHRFGIVAVALVIGLYLRDEVGRFVEVVPFNAVEKEEAPIQTGGKLDTVHSSFPKKVQSSKYPFYFIELIGVSMSSSRTKGIQNKVAYSESLDPGSSPG